MNSETLLWGCFDRHKLSFGAVLTESGAFGLGRFDWQPVHHLVIKKAPKKV